MAADAGGRFSSPDPLTDDLDPLNDSDIDVPMMSSAARPPPPPSSAAAANRRTAMMAKSRPKPRPLPYLDRSDFSLPPPSYSRGGSSSPARSSLGGGRRSPRKQTFELDVGDDRSPQRILVTVEAEENASAATTATKRGVKRKLFPPSSPTRGGGGGGIIRGEETTTTSVPLRGLTDDEGGGYGDGDGDEDAATPRKRGRPRRKSNGTPMPTTARAGRKRAGTPVRKTTATTTTTTTAQHQPRRNARKSGNDDVPPGSEASTARIGDAPATATITTTVEMDFDDDPDATPRARTKAKKPRIRKTPARPAAAVPSSQASSKPTGRKRGRPRKALMPDELAPLTESELERSMADAGRMATESEPPSDAVLPGETHIEGSRYGGSQADTAHADEEDLLMLGSTPTPSNPPTLEERELLRQYSEEGLPSSQHPVSEDGYEEEGEGYMPMMEPQSDLESDFDRANGVTYDRQDTLAHASDFSMIAVESLPSFQASYQADLSRIPSEGAEQEELGEETNMIINQTLESLRRSTQTEAEAGAEAERQSPDPLSADDHHEEQSQPGRSQRDSENLAAGNSRAWSKSPSRSPRKPKPVPLGRQLFSSKAGKAPQVDDSFSTLPDSLLQAATPRHLPMKQTNAGTANQDTSMYDDSFSEIPEAVLEAATPKRPTRTATSTGDGAPASDNSIERTHSTGRSGRSTLSSSRLPTPDDTSSSNNGSKRAQEEEEQAEADTDQQMAEGSNSHGVDIPSSPPLPHPSHSHVIDFGMSQMQRDASGTPKLPKSSPHLPTSGTAAPLEPTQSLEPPAHIGRPSLSPIVRVARTLQSVMSDRSSPEGRESNLGSPFRSSVSGGGEPYLSHHHRLSRSPTTQTQAQTQTQTQTNLHQHAHNNEPSVAHSQHAPSPASFNPISSFTQRLRSASQSRVQSQSQNQNQHQSQQRQTSPSVIGEVEDPFGPDIHNNTGRRAQPGGDSTSFAPANPPSEDQMSWAKSVSPEVQRRGHQLPSQQTEEPRSSSSFRVARASSTGASQAMDALAIQMDGAEHEHERAEEFADDESEAHGYDDHDGVGDESRFDDAHDELEGQDHEGAGGLSYDEDEDDDMDIWDIEASRPSPGDDDEPTRISLVVPRPRAEQAEAEPPRRSKIPSPWRRSTRRRLIYKDEVTSPSQIEIEEGAVSELDDDEYEMIPPIVPSRRTSLAAQRRRSQMQEQMQERETPEPEHAHEQDQEQKQEEEQHEQAGVHEEVVPQFQEHDTDAQGPEIDEYDDGDNYDMLAQHSDDYSVGEEERVQPPESDAYFTMEPAHDSQSPARSTRDEEYSLVAPSDRPDAETAQENSINTTEVEEYSLVAQNRKNNNNQNKPVAQEQEKGKRKSGFFGGFDILSFFSSPATLPKTRAEEDPKPAAAGTTAANTSTTSSTREPTKLAQPALSSNKNNKSLPDQSQSTATLWSNGLFPSVPQKESRPSPERRVDLFSAGPGPALQSNDTVADTYDEPSPSESTPSRSPPPSPSRPQPARSALVTHRSQTTRSPAIHSTLSNRSSVAPSTPERGQVYYPPIEQKQNFTPRPRDRQSPAPSSLFAPRNTQTQTQPQNHSRLAASNSNANNNNNSNINNRNTSVNFLQVPQLHLQDEQDQESSILTDGTDYERVPPREKPSQWDRTLSPSKSCFRSPLKPTTPGRVVAFEQADSSALSLLNKGYVAQQQQQMRLLQPSSGVGASPTKEMGTGKENVRLSSRQEDENPNINPSRYQNHNETTSALSETTNSSSLYPSLPPFQGKQVRNPRDHGDADLTTGTTSNATANNNGTTSTSASASASALQSPPTLARDAGAFLRPPQLSPTSWTREHWLRLDELAQLRRGDPARFRAAFYPPAAFYDQLGPDLDAAFASHRLCGKEVAAQGASVVLAPWHLEVVEAFRREVEGSLWDDVVLAKRLFALIVGAERRALRRRESAAAAAAADDAGRR